MAAVVEAGPRDVDSRLGLTPWSEVEKMAAMDGDGWSGVGFGVTGRSTALVNQASHGSIHGSMARESRSSCCVLDPPIHMPSRNCMRAAVAKG